MKLINCFLIFIICITSLCGQISNPKIDYVAKTELDHFRQLVELKFNTNDENLKKQALEYERRLGELNHEAEQLKSMQITYVSRELFDASVKERDAKIEALQKTVWIGIGIAIALQIAIAFFLKSQKITQA